MTQTHTPEQVSAQPLPGPSIVMHSPLPGYVDWFPMWTCDMCVQLVSEHGRVLWNGKPSPAETSMCSRVVSVCGEECALRLVQRFPDIEWLGMSAVDFIVSLAMGHGFSQEVADRISRASVDRLLRGVQLEPSTESGGSTDS